MYINLSETASSLQTTVLISIFYIWVKLSNVNVQSLTGKLEGPLGRFVLKKIIGTYICSLNEATKVLPSELLKIWIELYFRFYLAVSSDMTASSCRICGLNGKFKLISRGL